jgi:hypothetical protein
VRDSNKKRQPDRLPSHIYRVRITRVRTRPLGQEGLELEDWKIPIAPMHITTLGLGELG